MPRTKTFDEQEALDRAIELFWRQGYHATSVQDLVDALGINRSSLYDTFGGKRQLFDRAFARYQLLNRQSMQRFLGEQPEVRTGLRRLFTQAIEAGRQEQDRRGCFAVNVTTELMPGDAALRPVLESNKHRFEAIFLDYLKSGEERGDFPPGKDLVSIAALLYTLYNGLQVVAKVELDPQRLLAPVEAALGLLD